MRPLSDFFVPLSSLQKTVGKGDVIHSGYAYVTVILISNDQTSASKKINQMALIQTLTVSTIVFERKKDEQYGLWQTVYSDHNHNTRQVSRGNIFLAHNNHY